MFWVHVGIIPALAGNTVFPDLPPRRVRDHPRSRGEYPFLSPEEVAALGSSPLSRGILFNPLRKRSWGGIIPALAGNTEALKMMSGQTEGSSPLSRGIPVILQMQQGPPRIIPALAGNTFLGGA